MISGKLKQLVDHDPAIWWQRPRIIAARRWLLVGVLGLAAAGPGRAQDEREALESVRESIAGLEAQIDAEVSRMDADRVALRDIEKQVAEQRRAVDLTRAQQAAEQARLDELNDAVAAARVELGSEHDALSRQVLLSYMTGREELLKLVLNQESPAQLGRMITYYDFFNGYRRERIDAVRADLESLAALMRETRIAEQRLAELRASGEAELTELEAARAQRNTMITQRETRLSESGRTLDSLRGDEQRLTDLVVELGDILAAFPAGAEQSFAELQGRLAWPVSGPIVRDFGDLTDDGRQRSDGVVLDSQPGDVVRAVYYGRVAYTNWLPTFGLVMMLDHGDGYVSIYGQNEVLLRDIGEWVAPGDELAQLAGDGGRKGLYFALSHAGKPIDPKQWMRNAAGR
jgi:septal ring factor EnvC (AmiA/AmiB activator)